MENETTTPPVVTEETKPEVLSYRKNSACAVIHASILGMAGEFDLTMILSVSKEAAKTANVDLGNDVRTARHVIQQMLTAGQLVRVKRGRWTVKK